MAPENTPEQSKSNKISLNLDARLIIVALLLVIVGMFAAWRPWQAKTTAQDRTISVTGEAKLQATPDQFVFSPSYEFKNADKATALAALSAKSDQIVAKLKALGVADSQIKTNSNGGNSYYPYYTFDASTGYVYTLNLTITVNDKQLAQKVQDYLVTTTPTGEVSPRADFSTAKRKQLESQARDQATKEARAKADQSSRNLGFSIGKVKSVTDGGGFGNIMPMLDSGASSPKSSGTSLSVQPGQNELEYSVTVVYYLK